MASSSIEKRMRQEPGSACEQCRRRKLRCDRKQPECGLCAESGEQCVVTGSRKRGPKAGHMKALLARLSVVEEQLTSERKGDGPEAASASATAMPVDRSVEQPITTQPVERPVEQPVDHPTDLSFSGWVWSDNDDFGQGMLPDVGYPGANTTAGMHLDDANIMDTMHGGLNTQLQTTPPQAPMQMAGLTNSSFLTHSNLPSLAAPILPPNAAMQVNVSPVVSGQNMDLASFMPTIEMTQSMSSGVSALLPDLHHADRDQLYFDRVDECIPVIHEQQYQCWSNNLNKSEQQICLQQSMWALAISSSSHPIAVANVLYTDTRRRLEELEAVGTSHDLLDLMQAQAWLLIAVYEFVRVEFRCGWMSAGRAFRRIQLMKLHELDRSDPRSNSGSSPMEWVQREERRRTFWFAYALDQFVSLSNGSPPTLSDEADVRMPAPEMNFQSGQPITMRYLSDALHAADDIGNHPLTEFVIAATVCGWARSHRQQSISRRTLTDPAPAFWDRQRQIDRVLAPRVAVMSLHQPTSSRHISPILLFTHLIVQTMQIYVHRIILECPAYHDDSHRSVIDASSRNFSGAVVQMANMSLTLSQMSCFKAHTFCPIALSISLDCLKTLSENGNGFAEQTRMMSSALENLRRINILAGDQNACGDGHRGQSLSVSSGDGSGYQLTS